MSPTDMAIARADHAREFDGGGEVLLYISGRTQEAIEKFGTHAVATERQGSASPKDWEDARSYAVDVAAGLLRDNPQVWPFAAAMIAVIEGRKGRAR